MANNLVLGFFDGIHLAHRMVISSAVNEKIDGDTVIMITFVDSPSLYFRNISEYILPREESFDLAKQMGIDKVIVLDFSNIANMQALEYLEYLISTYSPKTISTGFNHTFGYNKSGNIDFLNKYSKEYNYKYICVPNYKIDNESVSSTAIKNYLRTGNIVKANKMLGYNFTLKGEVIEGNKLGRIIGFPTANLKYKQNIIKIPYGVYKTIVTANSESYTAIMNWGIKPTIKNVNEPIIEVHLKDFDKNLYGQNIKIEVLDKIRDERKFSDLHELKAQIERDIKCLEL